MTELDSFVYNKFGDKITILYDKNGYYIKKYYNDNKQFYMEHFLIDKNTTKKDAMMEAVKQFNYYKNAAEKIKERNKSFNY